MKTKNKTPNKYHHFMDNLKSGTATTEEQMVAYRYIERLLNQAGAQYLSGRDNHEHSIS